MTATLVEGRFLKVGDRFKEDYYGRQRTLEVTGPVFVHARGVVVPVRHAGETWLLPGQRVELVEEAR